MVGRSYGGDCWLLLLQFFFKFLSELVNKIYPSIKPKLNLTWLPVNTIGLKWDQMATFHFPNSNFCWKLPSTNLAIIIPWTFYWKHFNFHYSKLLIKQSRILKTSNWKTSCFMTRVFSKNHIMPIYCLLLSSWMTWHWRTETFVWYLILLFYS